MSPVSFSFCESILGKFSALAQQVSQVCLTPASPKPAMQRAGMGQQATSAGTMALCAEYPDWTNVRTCLPESPCVFTAVSPPVIREYEAQLLSSLQWPANTTPSQKACCVRVMSTQLFPLIQEYVQVRDHLQRYLAQLDQWHTRYLLRHLQEMESLLESLKEDMQTLKIGAHMHLHASATQSAPASVISSAQLSVADSIQEAQRVAASRRGQGPATKFASPNYQGSSGPTAGSEGAKPTEGKGKSDDS